MKKYRRFNRVFFDMDGVLADFAWHWLDTFHHRRKYETIIAEKPGTYFLHHALGITEEQFWSPVLAMGEKFWLDVPPLPFSNEFVNDVMSMLEVDEAWIATTPSRRDPSSAAAKLRWIGNHFPTFAGRVILIEDKHLLARRRSMLIDDMDSNCVAFRKAGGEAILYPQPWNKLHEMRRALKNEVKLHDYVLEKLWEMK